MCASRYLNNFTAVDQTFTYETEVVTNDRGFSIIGPITMSTEYEEYPLTTGAQPLLRDATPVVMMPAVTLVHKDVDKDGKDDDENSGTLNRSGVGLMAAVWGLAAALGAAFFASC